MFAQVLEHPVRRISEFLFLSEKGGAKMIISHFDAPADRSKDRPAAENSGSQSCRDIIAINPVEIPRLVDKSD